MVQTHFQEMALVKVQLISQEMLTHGIIFNSLNALKKQSNNGMVNSGQNRLKLSMASNKNRYKLGSKI